jgi:glycogen synthase
VRILIVGREYPPQTAWGGIATFNFHLALGLKKLGHDVDVLSCNLEVPSDTVDNGVRVIRVVNSMKTMPWDSSFLLYFYLYQRKIFAKFRELHAQQPYDVVDCADHLGEAYGIIRSGLVPTTLRFYTPWSLAAASAMNYKERWYDIYGVRWLERQSALNAHRLTCPSRDLSEKVTRFFDLRQPVEVIENPIDSDRFSPEDPLAGDTIRVLFVGRLEPRKGPDILAEAIPHVTREIDNIHFCFIGSDCPSPNSPSTRTELKHYLESKGAIGHVTFQDPVPLLDLPKWYNSAHIVVVPSRYDNSPYACLEAMSCGKPVVASLAGGAPEYLDHGNAGLLCPSEDPKSLAEAIVRLAKDRALRIELGNRARQRVVKRYDRKVVVARTCELYERAIEIHGRQVRVDRSRTKIPLDKDVRMSEDLSRKAEKIASIVRCPACYGKLEISAPDISCTACGTSYRFESNCPVLMTGEDREHLDRFLATHSSQTVPSANSKIRRLLFPPGPCHDPRRPERMARLWGRFDSNSVIVDVGAQSARLREDVITVDLVPFPGVDIVGNAHRLPVADNSVDLVINTGVLEHVEDADAVVSEFHRVVRPGGVVYTEIPFMQGYHPDPADFMRLTYSGLKRTFRRFHIEEMDVSSGPFSALAWVVREVLASIFTGPAKFTWAWMLSGWLSFWLKYLDRWIVQRPFSHRVASSYYVIARKPDSQD